ncbi:MAG: S8 family serine peptidase [Nitrospirota bacterium]
MRGAGGHRLIIITAVLIIALMGAFAELQAGVIEPALEKRLQSLGPNDLIPVIITLSDKADIASINDKDRSARRHKLVKALREQENSRTHKVIKTFLKDKEKAKKAKNFRSLWIINGMAVTLKAGVISQLEKLPGIESITMDYFIQAPVVSTTMTATPEWNLTAVKAAELWSLGFTGQGVVVASMDTGVDLTHPDLADRWRGGSNSWYDPHGQYPAPFDNDGHGTATMGIMVGGSAGGTQIGLAPDAKWIAVKIFDDAGNARLSDIHAGFQWLLDPDHNPATDDAPDVVNNSWGDVTANVCYRDFQADIQVLKKAEIAVVFAAGNSGPASSTSVDPANNPGSFAVGATDQNDVIAYFSSRGPSACDGSIFPHVVAPGVGIWSADLTKWGEPYYWYWDGTSFSAPHVSGTMALLRSAFPNATVNEMEIAIKYSAHDLGTTGPDNTYGYGLLDTVGAYNALRRMQNIGVFRSGKWYLDTGSGTWNAGTDPVYTFGLSTDTPLTGDWNGSGTTKIGTFRNGTWFLDNGNGVWNAGIDLVYTFGMAGDTPVTGNWNGDVTGKTKIGVFRAGKWYLDGNGNGAWDPGIDLVYTFGLSTDKPVIGDWDGSGATKIGAFRSGKWYLDNGNGRWDAGIDKVYTFGMAGDMPVTGDWNGDGKTEIGVIRGGTWYLDLNGNGKWDPGIDGVYAFGMAGDRPVAGKW